MILLENCLNVLPNINERFLEMSGVTTKEPIDQAVKKLDFSNFRLLCVLVVVCMCCVV